MEAAWVFFLEAAGAMGLLVFIVWWTMFSRPDIAKRPPPQEAGEPAAALPDQAQEQTQKQAAQQARHAAGRAGRQPARDSE